MTKKEAIEILQEEHDLAQKPSYVIKALEIAISAMTDSDWTHCVFIKHDRSDKKYIFCVDDTKKLKKGQRVLCDTVRGDVEGICVCASFYLHNSALEAIVQCLNAYLPLKRVVGTVELQTSVAHIIHRFDEMPF